MKYFYILALISSGFLSGCNNQTISASSEELDSITMQTGVEYELDSIRSSLEKMQITDQPFSQDQWDKLNQKITANIGAPSARIVGPRVARPNSLRGVRVVDGVKTISFPTTGALLKGKNKENAILQCTGTMITCNSFLTAAHCLTDYKIDPETNKEIEFQNVDPTNYHVFLQHSGIYSATHVAYPEKEYSFPNADLAIVTLSKTPVGIFTTPINDIARVPNATAGEIVGFGRTGGLNSDYGIKRTGRIETSSCPVEYVQDNLVCWEFNQMPGTPPGQNSNTCNGDSGGPMFTEHPVTGDNILAGVTSGGVEKNCLSGDNSYDVSVFNYNSWITSNASGALGQNLCGIAPHLGDDGVTVLAAGGSLDAVKNELLFDFPVSATTSRIIVTMNGVNDAYDNMDFDIFLNQGSRPISGQALCEQNGSGQFAECNIKDPAKGKWYVLVKRKKGAGDFQLVVTRFE